MDNLFSDVEDLGDAFLNAGQPAPIEAPNHRSLTLVSSEN
jgi:hypothetical protein